jgi:integrase
VRHDGVVRRRRRRGEGSVYRSDGSWIARFPLGTVKGKRVSKRVRCRSEREALAELERLRRSYGAGVEPAMGTVDAYLDGWLRSHGRKVRASTLTSYRGHVQLHISPLLGGLALSRLRPSDVRRLVDDLERKHLSPATIVRVITTLRMALSAAVRDRIIPDNAADIRELPRVERDPVKPLHHDEAYAIVEAVADSWVGPIVRLLLGSGMRLGEAIGLDQGDLELDLAYVRVRVSKTTIRAVGISDDAVAALRSCLASAPRRGPNEPVFFAPRGHGRLQGSSVTHALPRLLKPHGYGHITPHALRHGVATLMLADGVPMRVIAEQLGHKNPALTSRLYAHVIPESLRSAVGSLERRNAR